MDKSNISGMKEEELMYLRKMLEQERFKPTMLHTEMDREILEKGVFRAAIWPSLNGNPFIHFGIFMTVASFVVGMSTGGAHPRKVMAMMDYRVKFQFLTVFSIMGSFFVSTLRQQNREKLSAVEKLKAEVSALG